MTEEHGEGKKSCSPHCIQEQKRRRRGRKRKRENEGKRDGDRDREAETESSRTDATLPLTYFTQLDPTSQ